MDKISIRYPDDLHLHLRDDEALTHVLPYTTRQFRRAIVMPNLKHPIATVEAAAAYRQRILAALPAGADFTPLMTLYLTNQTTTEQIIRAAASGFIYGVKLYPTGVTTNSQFGITDLTSTTKVFEAMQAQGLPLLIHGELTNQSIDIFDREAAFIDQVMQPLRLKFPELRIVFEHITTKQAAQYVGETAKFDSSGRLLLAATITPQHLLFNRNALFKNGLQPHWYCLPILKREEHRLALVNAATSGLPQFFLGTDSAPHAKQMKEMACGCAGCYSAPIAMELYAQAFDSVVSLDKLENFSSVFGANFYNLPLNEGHLTLVRQYQQVPQELSYAYGKTIVPFLAGETLPWSVVY